MSRNAVARWGGADSTRCGLTLAKSTGSFGRTLRGLITIFLGRDEDIGLSFHEVHGMCM